MSTHSIEQPRVHLWTREEYYRMAEMGLIPERRVELIEGQVIERSPIGSKHASRVARLDHLLVERGDTLTLSQLPNVSLNVDDLLGKARG